MLLEAVHDTSAVLFTRSRVSRLPQRRELNRGSLRWILAGLRAVRFNSPPPVVMVPVYTPEFTRPSQNSWGYRGGLTGGVGIGQLGKVGSVFVSVALPFRNGKATVTKRCCGAHVCLIKGTDTSASLRRVVCAAAAGNRALAPSCSDATGGWGGEWR